MNTKISHEEALKLLAEARSDVFRLSQENIKLKSADAKREKEKQGFISIIKGSTIEKEKIQRLIDERKALRKESKRAIKLNKQIVADLSNEIVLLEGLIDE